MGRKLTIYMLDGSVTGPKTIEIGNWSGKAIYCPRGSLKELLQRAEFSSPGVYFLQSPAESFEFDSNIYIGEAESIGNRLKQHLSQRDFESVVCFFSKDELLTKSHIRYIESRLIQLARDANSAKIENSTLPQAAKISEADISDMEFFIDQIRLILPVVGLNVLVPSVPHASLGKEEKSNHKTYSIKSSHIVAKMIELNGGFVVLAGSEASVETSKSMADGWIKIRKKLLEANVLQVQQGKLIFVEDAVFSSPSAASSVVLGRQAPGPMVWLDEFGNRYKDVQMQLNS